MKRLLFPLLLLCISPFTSKAESFNHVFASYDYTLYTICSHEPGNIDYDNRGLNGFGIGYNHGFGVVRNLFIETGVNFNFGFYKESIEFWDALDMHFNRVQRMQHIDLTVPLNFVYRFNVTNSFKVEPFLGINMKVNLRNYYKTQIVHNHIDDCTDRVADNKWLDLYNDEDTNNYSWNRVQVGWQIGVGFEIKKIYLAMQYGTDFIHPFRFGRNLNHKGECQMFKASIGYSF